MSKSIVLVTGANGFIGQALCPILAQSGLKVRAAIRKSTTKLPDGYETAVIGDINAETQWEEPLRNVDIVIHLAARVHVMEDSSSDPLSEYRQVNVLGTKRLAHMAAMHGVRRFVYVSSIKVNGEMTQDKPFTEESPVDPKDPYAISKWEAEKVLQGISAKYDLEVVIVRLPPVYGPGVKGNLMRLLKLVHKRVPLPFGNINNKRSLIALDNIVDILLLCAKHPKAANEIFLVSDGEDLSTAQLINYIAEAFGKPNRLFPFPKSLLTIASKILNKEKEVSRLLGSLVIDSSKVRNLLSWAPVSPVKPALKRTVEWYLDIYRVKK